MDYSFCNDKYKNRFSRNPMDPRPFNMSSIMEQAPVWTDDFNITIIRSRVPVDHPCSPGVLFLEGYMHSVTLELPWRDNESNVSCIPSGVYDLKLKNSARFGQTVEVCNVPDRSHILFHAGNSEADTHGCILVGSSYSALNKTLGQSKDALSRFVGQVSRSLETRATKVPSPFSSLATKLYIGTFEEVVSFWGNKGKGK